MQDLEDIQHNKDAELKEIINNAEDTSDQLEKFHTFIIDSSDRISKLSRKAKGALTGLSLGIMGTLSLTSITYLNLNNHLLWYVSGALFGGSVGALVCPISEDERRDKIRNEANKILQELRNLERNYNPNNPIFLTRLQYYLERLRNVEEELKTLQNSSNIRKIKEVKQEISPEQYDKTIKNYLEPSDSFEAAYTIDLTKNKEKQKITNNRDITSGPDLNKYSGPDLNKYPGQNLDLTSYEEQDYVMSDEEQDQDYVMSDE